MKYKHKKRSHNLISPRIIVPEIMRLLSPKSVVDIGCGTGTFLNVFKSLGVTDILGIDGAWVNKNLLYENITPGEFLEYDLESKITLNKKYDLVLSLEVAEHLSYKSANLFVKSLVNAGKMIVFSAAIPYQGGQNHINEQWLTYWEEKFAKHNYVIHDILRPIFWDNPDVFFWYKQNMVLLAPKELELHFAEQSVPMRNIVHYDAYLAKVKELELHYERIWPRLKSSLPPHAKRLSSIGYDFYIWIKHLLTRYRKN